MFDDEKFAQRLAQLRMAKGVSARDMSLSLGQSDSYINKIENGRSLPSMQVFFYICEYLDISPAEFFSYGIKEPHITDELKRAAERLSPRQSIHLLDIINDILEK